MKKLLIAVVVYAAVLGGAGVALAPAHGPEYQAQYQADVNNFDAERDRVDGECIRPNLRPLIRDLLIPAREADTLEEARFHVVHALDVLARPGPAESVSKTIHTCVRQLGSYGIRIMRRHLDDVTP